MHLLIERRWRPGMQPGQELFEVLTPPNNRASLAAAENFLSVLTLGEPFSLEIAGDREIRWFLVRTGSESESERVQTQLAAAYPQAGFRGLELPHHLSLDPALPGPSEQVSTCIL